MIFDIIQCIVERNFCYATDDIRRSYALIKEALLDEKFKKVVLILHSQGGIEGALILDWLLGEGESCHFVCRLAPLTILPVPQDVLQQLEIYTFGNASNHFNNPHRSYSSMRNATQRKESNPYDKAVRHIEHYANSGELVARWGILSFCALKNRYMGRLFTRNGTGHLLNQHYLNDMFPLGSDLRVLEHNDFMNATVRIVTEGTPDEGREDVESTIRATRDEAMATVQDVNSPISPISVGSQNSVFGSDRAFSRPAMVKDFSRLWLYRNGMSPPS
jgi:hypothetical protein